MEIRKLIFFAKRKTKNTFSFKKKKIKFDDFCNGHMSGPAFQCIPAAQDGQSKKTPLNMSGPAGPIQLVQHVACCSSTALCGTRSKSDLLVRSADHLVAVEVLDDHADDARMQGATVEGQRHVVHDAVSASEEAIRDEDHVAVAAQEELKHLSVEGRHRCGARHSTLEQRPDLFFSHLTLER